MSTAKGSSKKKRSSEPTEASKSKSLKQRVLVDDDDDFGPEFSNDIKGIMTALQQIKEKAQKDGQKKNEETISSVSLDIKARIDELKSKIEKERQSFSKALSKRSKECENLLKSEAAKFQALCEKFSKKKAAHVQTLQDGRTGLCGVSSDGSMLAQCWEASEPEEQSKTGDMWGSGRATIATAFSDLL